MVFDREECLSVQSSLVATVRAEGASLNQPLSGTEECEPAVAFGVSRDGETWK